MRAVLVFCEGRHDVVFVRRSLCAVAKGDPFTGKIRDLPAPFGASEGVSPGLISSQYAKHELEGGGLAEAAHARPPTFEAVVTLPEDGLLCLLLDCGGDSKAGANIALVRSVANLVSKFSEPSSVNEAAFAFLFDADDAGVEVRKARFASEYAACLDGKPAGHADWVSGHLGPMGLFVFHDANTGNGTLEDALAPMVHDAWSERWHAAGVYLGDHAKESDPIRRGKASKLKKAQISITGQFLCPGESMSKVIDRHGLPSESFTGPVSRALVAFLRAVPPRREP
jgi:hypothetical protein